MKYMKYMLVIKRILGRNYTFQKREIKQPKLLCCILTSLAAVCINDVIFSQFCATPFFYLQYVVHVEGKEHKNNNAYVK